MNVTNVIVNGAHGRMGQVTCTAIEESPDFKLVARCDHLDDLAEKIAATKAQIVVDFTAAGQGYKNAQIIIEAGARPVVGTTGLTPEEIAHLSELCAAKKTGAVIAQNFSVGAVLMMRFAAQASAYFPNAEIIEIHHDKKLDAPSGTALKTAEMMAAARCSPPTKLGQLHENVTGSRGALYKEIPIHAIRLPGVISHQEVLFGTLGELLTIRHDSTSRDCFMPGVLLACRKVLELDHLVNGLEHLL